MHNEIIDEIQDKLISLYNGLTDTETALMFQEKELHKLKEQVSEKKIRLSSIINRISKIAEELAKKTEDLEKCKKMIK